MRPLHRISLGAGALLLLGLLTACETDEIISVEPGDLPGGSAASLEVVLGPSLLEGWTDTVFTAFGGPQNADFVRVESSPDLTSRALVRFSTFPDSVQFSDTTVAFASFDSGRVVLSIDADRSVLDSAGTVVQLWTMDQEWDARSADWEFAVDTLGMTQPWSSAGGALSELVAEATVTVADDTVVFPLAERTDSLIGVWDDPAAINGGLALVSTGTGRVALSTPRIHYVAVPEFRSDSMFALTSNPAAVTFIFDPDQPPLEPGTLRVGGIAGTRAYTRVVIPDSVSTAEGTVALRGATINRAEFVLTSLGSPDPPFAAETPFSAVAVELIDDFRMFGPKTPVGEVLSGSATAIDPDSLPAGSAIRLNVTAFVDEWAETDPDSAAPPLRIAVRSSPEISNMGYWEFGSAEGDPEFVPQLRIIFTPGTSFGIP